MKKYIFPILISILLFYPSQGFAEVKEIVSEGTYNMGDGETPSVAESRALLQAKRTALEQAGTYVESYSKVINLKLTEDEIQVLASGLMEVEILDKKRTVVGDGIHFWVKIKARVNLDKTEELANRIKAKDKSFVEDYKKIQEAYNKSQKDIEELKKELSEAKGAKEKKQVEAKITEVGKLYQAFEWYEKANKHILNEEYDAAIKAYTNSLSFGYGIYAAYAQRGYANAMKEQYDEAIEDYSKALDLSIINSISEDQYNKTQEQYNKSNVSNIPPPPSYHELTIKYAEVYYNRGISYARKRLYERAIEDFNKTIELNPNMAEAYSNRGEAFQKIGLYDRAIDDYSKVIALEPKSTGTYVARGISYDSKGDYERAILDYKRAISIGANLGYNEKDAAVLYIFIGMAYNEKGQYDMAIENLSKAIALDPNKREAYYQRSLAYAYAGRYAYGGQKIVEYANKAIEDLTKACYLGHQKSCKILLEDLKDR